MLSPAIQRATLADAPACLNTNDKAMWVTGHNEACDAMAAEFARLHAGLNAANSEVRDLKLAAPVAADPEPTLLQQNVFDLALKWYGTGVGKSDVAHELEMAVLAYKTALQPPTAAAEPEQTLEKELNQLAVAQRQLAQLRAVGQQAAPSMQDLAAGAFYPQVAGYDKQAAPAPAIFPARITNLLLEVIEDGWQNGEGKPIRADAEAALAWIAARSAPLPSVPILDFAPWPTNSAKNRADKSENKRLKGKTDLL